MSQVEETLGGLRIIKAFCAEEKMNTRFDRTNTSYREHLARVQIRAMIVSEFCSRSGPQIRCSMTSPRFYNGLLPLYHTTRRKKTLFPKNHSLQLLQKLQQLESKHHRL